CPASARSRSIMFSAISVPRPTFIAPPRHARRFRAPSRPALVRSRPTNPTDPMNPMNPTIGRHSSPYS
ncbi:hypothetical protein, partial [Burkholderia gladioli]|uniref:hypothetical protein n=1 Tax=Burkholderia gladioli TaxID=28095 RepID=UPI003F7B290D